LGTVLLDAGAFVAAYFCALAIRNADGLASWFGSGSITADWSLVVSLALVLLSFLAFGLYEQEVCVFRPLLLRTLVKGVLVATVLSAAAVYLVKSSEVNQSRFMLLATFAFFGIYTAALRLGVHARLYGRWTARERPVTLIVGRSARGEVLSRRLSHLKGFTRWRHTACDSPHPDDGSASGPPECTSCTRDCARNLGAALDDLRDQGRPVTAVFIDADGLALPAVLPAVQAARDRHVTVYVVSDLVRPMHSNRLLFQLFESPVVRVRANPPNGAVRRAKRVFDIAGASAALLVLAVPMGVIALAVKLGSPGPVLYRQRRIGLRGRQFDFLKFRSMVVGDHHDVHREYVQALIAGDVAACDQGDGEEQVAELKMADDARVTRVGRFIRRYSLDELPQFWNVLRGDMSLVGPRPPLPYEVEAYSEWQRQRLACLPGVSGLWQVGGRSRVSFDQMVFMDLFYQFNQSPVLDAIICLRTVPAVINGRGAG
jgi:exopolysaccharide biosynthesis polyprenyl glycosylphosphotransferase